MRTAEGVTHMEMRPSSPADVRRHLEAFLGAPPESTTGLVELLRAELSALGEVTRRVLVRRVLDRFGPAPSLSTESIEEALDELLAIGDFTSGPRGVLAPAPLRAVQITDGVTSSFVVLGGCKTDLLRARPGLHQLLPGTPRTLTISEDERPRFEVSVQEFGGIIITGEQWSGCDREAAADQSWLSALTDRLWTEGHSANELPEGFSVYTPDAARPRQSARWRSAPIGSEGLVRRRRGIAWTDYAWIKHVGSEKRVLFIEDAEAHRTTFALDDAAGAPLARIAHQKSTGCRTSMP